MLGISSLPYKGQTTFVVSFHCRKTGTSHSAFGFLSDFCGQRYVKISDYARKIVKSCYLCLGCHIIVSGFVHFASGKTRITSGQFVYIG